MNNFSEYITPVEAAKFAKEHGDKRKLSEIVAEFEERARDDSTCDNCDEKVWRYGGCGLCFTCTTGESDASEDYELISG